MPKIAVVIPAYKAALTIQKVIEHLPSFVCEVIVVDDCSPDNTSEIVTALQRNDPRITLHRHVSNQGVGGAVWTGYKIALEKGADVVVKMDSDDQMDPVYIEPLIRPIIDRRADYVKGNRFLHEKELVRMPWMRRIGNLGLSFLTKLASGYWNIFDPTNGYTAIRASLIPKLNEARIDRRYFFESSMLIELGMQRAVVRDISIPAKYGDEKSSLSELKSLIEFPPKLLRALIRRTIYLYFLRDFTAVSVFIVAGFLLSFFGFLWGVRHWVLSMQTGSESSTGTVMIAVLPLIIGLQLILQAVVLDIQNVPTEVLD